MTSKEKQSPKEDSTNSSMGKQGFLSLISPENLWKRLRRSKESRVNFVESHLDRSIAYQVRALREQRGWTQDRFAKELGMDRNNVSARLENPQYGSHSLNSLKKVAKAADVGLVVWFVPFSRMVKWATGTPYLDNGLTPKFYEVSDFDHDGLVQEAESSTQEIESSPGPNQRLNQLMSSVDDEKLGYEKSEDNPGIGSNPPLDNKFAGIPAMATGAY